MQKLSILTCLLLGSVFLHAQSYYAVAVRDSKNGDPIIGASIKIRSTGEILKTSESGNVVVLAFSTDSLHIQSKGYKDRGISLVNQSQAISILMTPVPKAVVASKPKKKRQ